jgi:RNA polymerase II-associated protein 1
MSLRGERFVVDFSDDEDEGSKARTVQSKSGNVKQSAFSFVGDIVERDTAAAKPPSAPSLKSSTTGFPEHKKRSKVSAFKQQRVSTVTSDSAKASPAPFNRSSQASLLTNSSSLIPKDDSLEEIERREIDAENRQRLAAMSAEEIEQERKELLANLSPSLIEALLKRANLDQGRGDTGINSDHGDPLRSSTPEASSTPHIEVPGSTAIPQPAGRWLTAARSVTFDDDAEPADPGILQPASDFSREAAALADPAFHFPAAPAAPDLDPSDPLFLESLHTKYFPSLPADPLKLAWMAPVPTHDSPADQDSPYYPGQKALPASALRFDFRGALLPPRTARSVPTTVGLHHHGEAPEAAGYTIPELARLARSAFPAQRCIAFQTLGRFLYRLGRGEWGDEGSEMAMGLWRCVNEGKVIETLEEAAAAEGGHQGSKVYAVEAVWLWQKGGGQKWKAS